jgi:hypothetical protein
VLDRHGKVVGVVVAGVRGSGVNFVIPVTHLLKHLEKPEITFSPPTIAREARHKPATFEARAVALLPGGKPLDLELVLENAGRSRKVQMKRAGDVFRASAIPVPAIEGPTRLHASIVFAEGSITGIVRDQAVQIAGEKRNLSEVRSVSWLPKARIDFRDGKSHEGAVTGLTEIEVSLGKEIVRVKLASASSATFDPMDGGSTVRCTVVARQAGKIVGQAEGLLTFGDQIAVLAGEWKVTFPRGFIRVYKIATDGKVSHTAADGKLWKGQVTRKDGMLVLSFEGGTAIERLRLGVDGRLLSEYWDPRRDFPAKSPHQIGIGVRQK